MDAWTWQQPFDGANPLDFASEDFDELTELEAPSGLENSRAFEALTELYSPLGFENPLAFDTLDEEDSLLGFHSPLGFDSPTLSDNAPAFDDFDVDAASGLFLPHQADTLISGPQALAMAQALNPFVTLALPADDVDAFFKRILRNAKGLARGVLRTVGNRIARTVGRGLGRFAKFAAPLLRRALPFVQRFARFVPGWGKLISAGLGAAQGLLEGRGLKGALAGALSGVVPGLGGKLAQAVLRGDAAEDDASLDALADLADAGYADGAVALPAGAGLAVRVAVRGGLAGTVPASARPAEAWLLRLGLALGGTAGRRLRILRSIGRLTAALLWRRRQAAMIRGAVLAAMRSAAHIVLARLRGQPMAGASSPAVAARRIAARQTILRNVPASALFDRYPGMAVA